jgi:pimeloyl-ACP methyl ester carboxylesterase
VGQRNSLSRRPWISYRGARSSRVRRTSKPSDPQAYNSKDMAKDLIDILDNEGYRYAISVGHDWGSYIAGRLPLWHPNRSVGLIQLNVAYRAPAEFDVDKANQVFLTLPVCRLLRTRSFWFSFCPGLARRTSRIFVHGFQRQRRWDEEFGRRPVVSLRKSVQVIFLILDT